MTEKQNLQKSQRRGLELRIFGSKDVGDKAQNNARRKQLNTYSVINMKDVLQLTT